MISFRDHQLANIQESELSTTEILGRELLKVKNKNSDLYKKIHKLMMTMKSQDAKIGLDMIKKFKSTLMSK
jgi:hypothetical protein